MNLNDMKATELREVARNMGVSLIKHEKAEHLRARLTLLMHPEMLQQLSESGIEQPLNEQLPKKIEHYENTTADIQSAIEPFKARLKLSFNEQEQTWRIQNGVAEDSGPFNMPLDVIKRKARSIYDARLPAVVDGREFEPGSKILA